MSRLAEVLADLRAESDQLEDLLVPLPPESWCVPTPAAGWDVAHHVAHLAWTDECAVEAATDPRAWQATLARAGQDPDGFTDTAAAEGAEAAPAALLDRWRSSRAALAEALAAVPEGTRIPWFGPPMSATSMATARFMETWAHGRDVAAALGVELPPHDRVRHVVHLGVRTRAFSYAARGRPVPDTDVRVRLTLPGGDEVGHGAADAPDSVTGSAHDFALVVTQRLHPADADLVAAGDHAQEWLSLAQAFAGPPGPGRPAR